MSDDGMIVLDTPESIEAYYMLARYNALKLEISTGMTYSRGSVMNFLKEKHGFKGGTKRMVLKQYEVFLKEKGILSDDSDNPPST